MVTEENQMNNTDAILETSKLDDIIEFAKYLNIDPEDYLDFIQGDVDIDDLSR